MNITVLKGSMSSYLYQKIQQNTTHKQNTNGNHMSAYIATMFHYQNVVVTINSTFIPLLKCSFDMIYGQSIQIMIRQINAYFS